MEKTRTRRFVTLLLIFGAVVFGMVLAGGLGITVPGVSSQNSDEAELSAGPVTVPTGLPDFATLAERVSPAVVSIQTASYESRPRGHRVDPFEFFFGPRRRGDEREQDDDDQPEFRQDSGGSGFLISAEGLVVTNNHVIDGADEIEVNLGDSVVEAEIVGADPATDLAVLKIAVDEQLPYLALGDSQSLRVGEWVMAIGSPLRGLTDTVTVGVVSGKGRQLGMSLETTSFENFIQTDAAINFGNSGGPLINLRGEVVGINTAINYGSENIGFAVPVATLQQILPQLVDGGKVRRGYLGIGVENLDRRAVEGFGLGSTDGALVTQVMEGQPAAAAGIKIGDVILMVDDREIANTRELIDYVSAVGPDKSVTLKIVRNGETLEKRVKLAERTGGDTASTERDSERESTIDWLGIRYQDLTPGLRSMHGLPEDLEGVWVTSISPRSPLYDEGVRSNNRVLNIITQVNGNDVESVEQFEELVQAAESGSRMRLYLRRFADGDEVAPVFAFPAVP